MNRSHIVQKYAVRLLLGISLTGSIVGTPVQAAEPRCRDLEIKRSRLMRDRVSIEGELRSARRQLSSISRSMSRQALRIEGILLTADRQLTLKTEQIANKLGRIYDGEDQTITEGEITALVLDATTRARWTCPFKADMPFPIAPEPVIPSTLVDLAQVSSAFSEDFEYRYGRAPAGSYPGVDYDKRQYAIKKNAFMVKLQRSIVKIGLSEVSKCEAVRSLVFLKNGLPISSQQRAKYQRLLDKQVKNQGQMSRIEDLIAGIESLLEKPGSCV
jgi:hypothetical protein